MTDTLGQFVREVNPPPDDAPEPYVIGSASGVKETIKQMGRAVMNPTEVQRQLDEEELAASEPSIAAAFDRGAKLAMPEVPSGPLDDSYRAAKERIEAQMGKRGTAATARKTTSGPKPAGSDEITKLFATGLVTLITFTLGEWALPTAEEATELSRPLANILSRRIDLAAKLGKDGNDTIAFAIAVMAYMVRVGPIAQEKVKDAWRDRQDRTRVDRVLPDRSWDTNGESSVDAGSPVGAGTGLGPTRNPLDALAQTRDAQLGGLDRQFGYDQGSGAPVGNVR